MDRAVAHSAYQVEQWGHRLAMWRWFPVCAAAWLCRKAVSAYHSDRPHRFMTLTLALLGFLTRRLAVSLTVGPERREWSQRLANPSSFCGIGPGLIPMPASVVTATVCLGCPDEATQLRMLDPKHRIISAYRGPCDNPGQAGAQVIGPVFAMVHVARQCSCNALNALCMRHGVVQPIVELPLMEHGCLRHEDILLRRAVAYEMYPHCLEEVQRTWLVASGGEVVLSKWTGTKARAILRSLIRDRVMGDRVNAFVKREISKITLDGEPLTKARLIQGYVNEASHEAYAREFRAFQKALVGICSVSQPYEYAPGIYLSIQSGSSVRDTAHWAEAPAEWYYERDGKSWDATMSRPHFDYKFSFLEACDTRLAAFAAEGFAVKGYSKCRRSGNDLVYSLHGTVKSGHCDTTSGNSLINAVISARALMMVGLQGRILVAGDDMLAAITTPLAGVPHEVYAARLADAERRMGIMPEYSSFIDVVDTSFISACFIRVSGRLFFLPQLGRLLAKLWYTVHPVHVKRLDSFTAGMRQCMASVVGNFPLYSEFVALGADPKRVKPIKYETFNWVEQTVAPEVDVDAAYEALSERYGLSVPTLRDFAEFLRSLPRSQAGIANHPVATHIIHRDLTSVESRPRQCSGS